MIAVTEVGLADVIAAALCAQEEQAERDGDASWWGWSTDDIAAMLARAVAPIVAAETDELRRENQNLRDAHEITRDFIDALQAKLTASAVVASSGEAE